MEAHAGIGITDGVDRPRSWGSLLSVLRDFFAPSAADVANQDVVKFSHFRKTAQAVRGYLVEFDLPRNAAEKRMQPGCTFSKALAAALCLRNAICPEV